jgi:hypothetical protein
MAEEQRLLPPHMPFDEYKAQRQLKKPSTLTCEEATKRELAHQAASAVQSRSKTDLTAQMLNLASPNIRDEIILKLSAEDALEVAEKITDSQLRDALVKHSLGALYPLPHVQRILG